MRRERSMKRAGFSRDAARSVVKRELQRSFERYAPPTEPSQVEALLLSMARRRRDLVVILDNRLFVHETFLSEGTEAERRGKCRHLKIVYAALSKTGRGLPNAAYLYSKFPTATTPKNDDASTKKKKRKDDQQQQQQQVSPSCAGLAPELVVAKPGGYVECGILVPGVVFVEPKTALNRTERFRRVVSEESWKERAPKAIWRGRSVDVDASSPLHCTVARSFARARLEVLALSRTTAKLFQCHCAVGEPCDFHDGATCGKGRRLSSSPTNTKKYAAAMRDLASEDRSKHSKEALGLALLTKFKYVLSVPYDWRLNVLWTLGGVVLLWDSPLVEWYYPALQHDVTHWAVDLDTAPAAVDFLERTPDDVARLRRNALKLHNVLLCPDCATAFFGLVVNSLRRYFRLYDVLDDHAKRSTFLREALGSWTSELLEVKFGTTLTMVAIYQDESYNVLKKMIASTEESDSLMFHRTVAGDNLNPTTNWRLHDWRPDQDVPGL
mmetsp:Transcript_24131/g.74387  ORF Transcript_24131/g.74387 Transcript_24131/m.74387 type:complete len:496 (-) Transcript_24131:73-1560(-)